MGSKANNDESLGLIQQGTDDLLLPSCRIPSQKAAKEAAGKSLVVAGIMSRRCAHPSCRTSLRAQFVVVDLRY